MDPNQNHDGGRAREPYVSYGWQGDWLLALLALAGVVGLLTLYAAELNTQYYRTQAPFFDSAAYANHMASIVGTTRKQGFGAGLAVATGHSTAPLYNLEALALTVTGLMPARVSRHVPIWMQSLWLLLAAVSIYFYWFGFRGRGAWTSILFTLPFLTFTGIFLHNGGLSDFRLDLSLYIFLSFTLTWYLYTREVDGWLPWLIAGIGAALASLSRATAPVYLTVMLGPPLLARLIATPGAARLRLLKHIGLLIAPAAVLAGAFFAYNFSYLYYYYVHWNADANARLPLAESARHFVLAAAHVGVPLAAAVTAFGATLLAENRARLRSEGLRAFDWTLLYMGFAPVLFLVLRGAGWNPFVSMPAVFGWLMFGLAPLRGHAPVLRTPLTVMGMMAVVFACGWNIVVAPSTQTLSNAPRIAAIRQGIDLMRQDARAKGLRRINFLTSHLWDYQATFIRNVLIYEYGCTVVGNDLTGADGVAWSSYGEPEFSPPVRIVWDENIAGSTDAEKIETLLGIARKDVNYMFFPDDATLDEIERGMTHNFINTKIRALRKRFLESGEWQPVGGPLTISDLETVRLYAKQPRP